MSCEIYPYFSVRPRKGELVGARPSATISCAWCSLCPQHLYNQNQPRWPASGALVTPCGLGRAGATIKRRIALPAPSNNRVYKAKTIGVCRGLSSAQEAAKVYQDWHR